MARLMKLKQNSLMAGITMAYAPKHIQNIAKAAIQNQIELEKEQCEADSIGVTLEQYRIIKILPGGWVDWSKVGK